jgi:hypothetical protein
MAAYKKGQAFAGPYTQTDTITSDSAIHDSEGYLIGNGEKAASIEAASKRTKDFIAEVSGANGLSADLPKK